LAGESLVRRAGLPPSLAKGRGSADKRGAKPLSYPPMADFPLSLKGEGFILKGIKSLPCT